MADVYLDKEAVIELQETVRLLSSIEQEPEAQTSFGGLSLHVVPIILHPLLEKGRVFRGSVDRIIRG